MKCKKNIGLSRLIKIIKKFDVKKFNDVAEVKILSEMIYEEWLVLQDKNKRKLIKQRENDSLVHIQQIVEEQIVVGLFCLLAQKIATYVEMVS